MNNAAVLEQADQYTPQNANPVYRVDNWQIPVPIGDASAHFLVEVVRPKPRVINAFFMDGGDDAQKNGNDTALAKIKEALKFIDKQYQGNQWKFDAVATTHHDRDHYWGLAELLAPGEKIKRNKKVATYREAYFAQNLTYYSGNPGNTGLQRFKWMPQPCACVLAGQDAIGVDMFSRTRMFSRHGTLNMKRYDTSLGVRRCTYDDEELRRPRFVIMGANGFSVRCDSTEPFVPTPTENEKSLLAVVYWPGNGGHSSYFTGGDGNPKVELEGVVPWMENPPKLKKYYPKLPVDMVKLDHHGSLNETLNSKAVKNCHSTILDKMQPRNILVTPGNKHGHPNWAIMQLIRNYLYSKGTMTDESEDDEPNGNLYTTRSPYWMSKKKTNMLDTNTNHAGSAKVKAVLKNMGAGPDNQDVDHDYLLQNEMEQWDADYIESKRQISDLVDQIKALAAWQGCFDATGKLKTEMLNKQLKKQDKATMKQLANSTRVLKTRLNDFRPDEPPLTSRQILKQVVDDNRQVIVWHARQAWEEICEQKICDEGSVYFLIRFSFEENKEPEINCSMDETGQVKPTKAPILPNTDDNVEWGHVDSYDGDRYATISTTNPETGKIKQDKFKYAEGLESYRQTLGYVRYEMHELNNFKLGSHFNRIYLVEEQTENPINYFTQLAPDSPQDFLGTGGGKKTKTPKSKKQQQQPRPTTPPITSRISDFIDVATAPTSKKVDDGKGGHKFIDIIEEPDWTHETVTDSTINGPNNTTAFLGGYDVLYDFRLFMDKYCSNAKKFAPFTTEWGPKIKGLGRGKKAPTISQVAILDDMFAQWTTLRDMHEAHALRQYQGTLSSHLIVLKRERATRLRYRNMYVYSKPARGGKRTDLTSGDDDDNGDDDMVQKKVK